MNRISLVLALLLSGAAAAQDMPSYDGVHQAPAARLQDERHDFLLKLREETLRFIRTKMPGYAAASTASVEPTALESDLVRLTAAAFELEALRPLTAPARPLDFGRTDQPRNRLEERLAAIDRNIEHAHTSLTDARNDLQDGFDEFAVEQEVMAMASLRHWTRLRARLLEDSMRAR